LADSVTVCSALNTAGIQEFLNSRWNQRSAMDAGYGDGHAMRHFVEIIKSDDFWNKADQKVFHQSS
jgi:UDP-N-acetylglucosamine 2-epimerase (hydrolysing)